MDALNLTWTQIEDVIDRASDDELVSVRATQVSSAAAEVLKEAALNQCPVWMRHPTFGQQLVRVLGLNVSVYAADPRFAELSMTVCVQKPQPNS